MRRFVVEVWTKDGKSFLLPLDGEDVTARIFERENLGVVTQSSIRMELGVSLDWIRDTLSSFNDDGWDINPEDVENFAVVELLTIK